MNCFNHENVPAVGVCHACGKGLCRDCASETARGLACAAPCAASLEPDPAVGLLQRLSAKMCSDATEAQHELAFYGMLLGIIGVILTPVAYRFLANSTTSIAPFLVTGSALFIGLGAVIFVATSKLQSSQARSFRAAAATLTSGDAEETASE